MTVVFVSMRWLVIYAFLSRSRIFLPYQLKCYDIYTAVNWEKYFEQDGIFIVSLMLGHGTLV